MSSMGVVWIFSGIAHCMPKSIIFLEPMVAMISKQYNPFTDCRVRLSLGVPLMQASNEVPAWRYTAGVLGAARFGTTYKTGLKYLTEPYLPLI